MEFIPARLPLFVKKLFPKYTWNLPTEEKVLYLTFDDGPTPIITNWVLDLLEKYQAKATFFCIGNNVEKHSDIFQNILKKGHTIGNHSYSHPNGWKTSMEDYISNTEQAQVMIDFELQQSRINNHQESTIPKLFRPPYGRITNTQGRVLMSKGYHIIMWHVLAFDWSLKTNKAKCLKNVINNAKNGSIVVFHDSEKASQNMQYALPKTLEFFSKKGYKFKSLNPETLGITNTLE